MSFEYLSLHGKEIQNYFLEIANLRIEVFKEFPYLYEGRIEYEQDYLKRYIQASNSLICLVKNGDQIIGMTSAISLNDEDPDIKEQYMKLGFNPQTTCYFGESIIKFKYRGQGIGKKFFEIREDFSNHKIKNLEFTTFCAVKREIDHTLRPRDYFDLAPFWSKLGYQKTDQSIQLKWKDIDKSAEDYKSLTVWKKSFKQL